MSLSDKFDWSVIGAILLASLVVVVAELLE